MNEKKQVTTANTANTAENQRVENADYLCFRRVRRVAVVDSLMTPRGA